MARPFTPTNEELRDAWEKELRETLDTKEAPFGDLKGYNRLPSLHVIGTAMAMAHEAAAEEDIPRATAGAILRATMAAAIANGIVLGLRIAEKRQQETAPK